MARILSRSMLSLGCMASPCIPAELSISSTAPGDGCGPNPCSGHDVMPVDDYPGLGRRPKKCGIGMDPHPDQNLFGPGQAGQGAAGADDPAHLVRSLPRAISILPPGPYTCLMRPAWRSRAVLTAARASSQARAISGSAAGMGTTCLSGSGVPRRAASSSRPMRAMRLPAFAVNAQIPFHRALGQGLGIEQNGIDFVGTGSDGIAGRWWRADVEDHEVAQALVQGNGGVEHRAGHRLDGPVHQLPDLAHAGGVDDVFFKGGLDCAAGGLDVELVDARIDVLHHDEPVAGGPKYAPYFLLNGDIAGVNQGTGRSRLASFSAFSRTMPRSL